MSPMAVLLAAALFSGDGASAADKASADRPQVVFETSLGTFVLELDRKKAPVTVDNFLGYVRSGHYAGTIFHRVIPGFMVQGGGFDTQMSQKRVGAPIENEAKNGLKNDRGTCQFFINTVNNDGLNRPKPDGHGYAVFGHVVEGMDVVDKIEKVKTGNKGGHQNVPVEPVTIVKATVKE